MNNFICVYIIVFFLVFTVSRDRPRNVTAEVVNDTVSIQSYTSSKDYMNYETQNYCKLIIVKQWEWSKMYILPPAMATILYNKAELYYVHQNKSTSHITHK